jgi:hypothetical protein
MAAKADNTKLRAQDFIFFLLWLWWGWTTAVRFGSSYLLNFAFDLIFFTPQPTYIAKYLLSTFNEKLNGVRNLGICVVEFVAMNLAAVGQQETADNCAESSPSGL